MNAVVRLDPRAYRRTPWKNGGGVTMHLPDVGPYWTGAE